MNDKYYIFIISIMNVIHNIILLIILIGQQYRTSLPNYKDLPSSLVAHIVNAISINSGYTSKIVVN